MKSIMKKRIAVLFLLTAVFCSLFAGCAEEKAQPEDTIFQLQEAINKLDVDGFLQCIDSERVSQLESIFALIPGKNDFSVGSYLSMVRTIVPVLPFVSNGTLTSEDFPKVEFTVLETDILDNAAVVAISGALSWGEYTKTFAATVDMKLENDAWVVCGVR